MSVHNKRGMLCTGSGLKVLRETEATVGPLFSERSSTTYGKDEAAVL